MLVASMRKFQRFLANKGIPVILIAADQNQPLTAVCNQLKQYQVFMFDPLDRDLYKEIRPLKSITFIDPLQFYLPKLTKKYRSLQHFYQFMVGEYLGDSVFDGKSTDRQNRNPLSANHKFQHQKQTQLCDDQVLKSINYVNLHFQQNPGIAEKQSIWFPTDEQQAKQMLKQFVKQLDLFGTYQDAIDRADFPLQIYHSRLSCALNTGLLLPQYVISRVVKHTNQRNYNGAEAFIRQILGWREYSLYVFRENYRLNRYPNHFGLKCKLKKNHWNGRNRTGIEVLDETVSKTVKYGYCHHIERLMILLNLMILLEINPKDAYEWFMQMFVDSTDWVMYFNVICMGYYDTRYTRKPYISSSNYIQKMSGGRYARDPAFDNLYRVFLKTHSSKIKFLYY